MRVILFLLVCLGGPARAEIQEIVPGVRIAWAPDMETVTLRFDAGCMSSSVRVAGDTLVARADPGNLLISGAFLVEQPAGIVALTDMGQCPEHTVIVTGVRPGSYSVRYKGRPVQTIILSDAPLQIGLFLTPWPTVRDLRDAGRYGVHRLWQDLPPARTMSPIYLDQAGPARIRDRPGHLLVHVVPDPLLYWSPTSQSVTFMFRFGCLPPNHLFMGANPAVAYNERQRSFTVTGDIRYLPLPPGHATDGCIRNPVGTLHFPRIPKGDHTVIQDGEILFHVTFDRLDFNAGRFGQRYLE